LNLGEKADAGGSTKNGPGQEILTHEKGGMKKSVKALKEKTFEINHRAHLKPEWEKKK